MATLSCPTTRTSFIDFTGLAGQEFILYYDAPTPFPAGPATNDYFLIMGLRKGSPIQVSLASSAIIRAGAPALQYRSFAASRLQVRPTSQHLGRKRGTDRLSNVHASKPSETSNSRSELKTQESSSRMQIGAPFPDRESLASRPFMNLFFGSVRESKLIRSMICVSLTGLLTTPK
jgi:hypothetical protein